MSQIEKKIALVGPRGSGKTTYLLALQYQIRNLVHLESGLEFEKLPEFSDRLRALQHLWLEGKKQERTSLSAETSEELGLLRTKSGLSFNLILPNLSGEGFREQWVARHYTAAYAALIKEANGIVLFVHAGAIKEPLWIAQVSDAAQELNEPDDQGNPDEREANVAEAIVDKVQWSPQLFPTQVQLVELLQFAEELRRPFPMPPLSVVISAWDLAEKLHVTPEEFLTERLAMLAQYLRANSSVWNTAVYGVSAFGGNPKDDPKKVLKEDRPENRPTVVGNGYDGRDLFSGRSANAPMRDIHLNQTLHGYLDGHQLLRSSFDLSKQAAREVLILSDLSGTVVPGFDGYLTAYYLPTDRLFALAKTWYASDVFRPGAVWTQTIYIRKNDIAAVDDLEDVCALFARPESEDLASYQQPLNLYVKPAVTLDSDAFSDRQISSLPYPFVQRISEEYYSDKGSFCVLPSEGPLEHIGVYFALWRQAWPALRMRLSFCTCAADIRYRGDSALDLQSVPRALFPIVRRRAAAAGAVIIDRTDLADLRDVQWSGVIARDLTSVVPSFRAIVNGVGPLLPDTPRSMQQLRKIVLPDRNRQVKKATRCRPYRACS